MENLFQKKEPVVKRGAKKYPNDVVSISTTGKEEARVLEKRGTFIKYNYEDVFSGNSEKKYTLLLKDENGNIEHLFVLPASNGKELVVKHVNEGKKKRRIWDPRLKTATEF
ncbi:MAG: hypothetical protein NT001_05165 [Candidatus Woesearchaeota archaeon]|nr:hypothetical protein [Candidatus Woesearchaeota archaeon]